MKVRWPGEPNSGRNKRQKRRVYAVVKVTRSQEHGQTDMASVTQFGIPRAAIAARRPTEAVDRMFSACRSPVIEGFAECC
jgi:hypothetical protein